MTAVVATNTGGVITVAPGDTTDAADAAKDGAAVGIATDELEAIALCAAANPGQVLTSNAETGVDSGRVRLATLAPPTQVFTIGDGSPLALDETLPYRHARFVGPADYVVETTNAVRGGGVVTVTGPGGVGKTETVLRAGALASLVRRSAVRLVELAPLSQGDAGPAIARALATETPTVVVLDNAEHVLDDVVAALAAVPSHISVVVSSRTPLGLDGETVIVLPLLGADDAATLFIDRARRAGATPTNTADVAALCARLDHLPLAIELAAARSRVLSPQAITERLDDRFGLLQTRAATSPTHHASLEAAIGWSVDLLDATQRDALQRLAVFADRFDLDMAGHVGVDLDTLEDLITQSLVASEPEAAAPYRLLDSVRAFIRATGQVADAERGRMRWLLDITEVLDDYSSPDRDALHARLDSSPADVRGAIETAIATDRATAVGLVGRLGAWFWDRGRLAEGKELAAAVLAVDPEDDPLATARLENVLANITVRTGDAAGAVPHYERALAIREAQGARMNQIASTRNDLGACLMHLGDLDGASAMLTQSRDDYASVDDDWGVATATTNLAAVAVTAGRYDGALDAFRQAAHAFSAMGDIAHAAAARTNEGLVLLELDQPAAPTFVEAIALIFRSGVRYLLPPALAGLATAAHQHGAHDTAARLLGAALRAGFDDTEIRRTIEATIGLVATETHVAEGRAADDDQILAWAGSIEPTAKPAGPTASPTDTAELRRAGDGWHIAFCGHATVVPVRKGIAYLAALLQHPGREIHVATLTDSNTTQRGVDAIDDAALAAYRHRVLELERRLEDADRRGDVQASVAAEAELDHLKAELRRSTDRKGKPRQVGGDDERARKSVGNRIRDAIELIGRAHPELGRHLEVSVTTGTYCVYAPEHPVDWHVSAT